MRLRHNRRFDLEASCWGKAREEVDPYFLVCASRWFAPLEYGDAEAAQLRVSGTLTADDRMAVESVEEVS